jgi:hypothetical protein
LDGRAALMVVRVMRKLAQTGRAIICKFFAFGLVCGVGLFPCVPAFFLSFRLRCFN